MSAEGSTGLASRFIEVRGSQMHYRVSGEGRPILFLHGNPTSSYLWRHVMPHVRAQGQCIALDLIGMGKSEKPDIAYRFAEHLEYVAAFIEQLRLRDLVLVMHDWGMAIGLHYARTHPEHVRGLAFMEGHLKGVASWQDFDRGSREMFQRLRTEDVGRQMILEENFFIETVLPSGIVRTLSSAEMDTYREPYSEVWTREPIWRWVQEIPIEGKPTDVANIVDENERFLMTTALPKLLPYAVPGALIGTEEVAWCRENLRNLTAVSVGEGYHFLPEDSPAEIGEALSHWLVAAV